MNHIDVKGAIPSVKIINWQDRYITLDVVVANTTTTSFVYPEKGQTCDELIKEITKAFNSASIELKPD